MNSDKQDTAAPRVDALDISALLHLALANLRLIVIAAAVFLLAAVAWTGLRGPLYEATAFVEVEDAAEVATVAQKLRFASVYQLAADGDGQAAVALARRTRVKAIRDSRLIGVTVRGEEPEQCAASADKIVVAFLEGQTAPSADPVETFDLPLDDSLAQVRPASQLSPSAPVWKAEQAAVPSEPAGPMSLLIWLAAAAAGAFSGFVLVLLRNS